MFFLSHFGTPRALGCQNGPTLAQVVVLGDGQVLEIGNPAELEARLASREGFFGGESCFFGAGFLGGSQVLAGFICFFFFHGFA